MAVLSHELRTPMNAILGWTHLLRTRKFEAAAMERALETIERNSRSLSQLIEDVLDVSKVVRGKLQLQIRPVELVSLIETSIETVESAARLKGIQVDFGFDDAIGLVLADGNRLQQVIWNLLSNAIKFTPKGGRVEVQLSSVEAELLEMPSKAAHYIKIQIKDTGKGIAPEFLPYVFERFRQENNSTTRTYGGLGLGLGIVRHLVELHGGTVWADSLGEGKGATFEVLLPFVSPILNEADLVATEEDFSALAGLRVLVVDDDADARELVGTMLRQYAVEVTEVASASEGWEALQRLQSDVLVCDIGMPQEDGYSLIRKIRAQPSVETVRSIPAVALTAYAREEDRVKALAAGFQEHLSKPIDPMRLVQIILKLAATGV